MEIEKGVAPQLLEKLSEELELRASEIFAQAPPLDLTYLFEMADFEFPNLKDVALRSVRPSAFDEIDRQNPDEFFGAIRQGENFAAPPVSKLHLHRDPLCRTGSA